MNWINVYAGIKVIEYLISAVVILGFLIILIIISIKNK